MSQTITLYTNPMSRGRIVRWMLEELGIAYETKIIDYAKDMKLPFKTHDCSHISNLSIQDVAKIFEINIPLVKHFKEIKRNYYYAFHFSSFSEFSIFQPPELV